MIKSFGYEPATYRYYDLNKRQFEFSSMIEDLAKIPENAVVLFHAIGHNPTGFDPTDTQWEQIMNICRERKFLNIFDMAYQGFVSGCPERDSFAVRLFTKNKMPVIVSQSFAKNFGLYGQRVGCVSMPCVDKEMAKNLKDWLG